LDTNEQQVAHGTGLVPMASMIISHDTIDHHDLADNPNEDDTAIETIALLSLTEVDKVSIESDIMVGTESLPSHYIFLDTCGSANVFSNSNLLFNIRPASQGLIIDGIRKDSKLVITYKEGDTCFGSARFSSDARGNVLSFAMTHDRCSFVQYDFEQDCHFIRMKKNGPYYVFV
jgi:hypothetical protein